MRRDEWEEQRGLKKEKEGANILIFVSEQQIYKWDLFFPAMSVLFVIMYFAKMCQAYSKTGLFSQRNSETITYKDSNKPRVKVKLLGRTNHPNIS